MALQRIQWTSSKKLACAGCSPEDVWLWLARPEIIDQQACPLDPLVIPEITEDTDFVFHTIPASLIDARRLPNPCGGALYKYTFSYDDALLVSNASLVSRDILGVVCKGALTTLVQDLVGDDVKVESVAATESTLEHLVLTNQHGCQFNLGVGITSVATHNQCGTPGIGAAKTIRDLDVVGGVLILDAAEMDIGVQFSLENTFSLDAVNVHTPAEYLLGSSDPLILQNPSLCKPAVINLGLTMTFGGSFSPGYSCRYEMNLVSTEGDRTFAWYWMNSGNISYVGDIAQGSYQSLNYIIDPGDTIVVHLETNLVTVSGGSGTDSAYGTVTQGLIAAGQTCVSYTS